MTPKQFAKAARENDAAAKRDAFAITRRQTRKNWKIPANVVLTFISQNPEYMPTLENYGDFTIEEEILRVRHVLWRSRPRFNRVMALTKSQNVTNISEAVLVTLLGASRQKKYRERGSPAFSAGALCGALLRGNDGVMYRSVRNAAGVCTWVSSS